MAISKKEIILQAALELFSERGYDGTTVPMIADKARVGAGTIYRYFENKENLVNDLFQECVDSISNRIIPEEIQSLTEFRQQFQYIFRRLIDFAENNIHALIFMESYHHTHYLNQTSKEKMKYFMGKLRHMIDMGKASGEVKELQTEALIAIVYGAFVLLFKLVKNGVIEQTEDLLMGVEESCWNAITVR